MPNSHFTKQRGWIYICVDPKDISICKIGMTRRGLYERATETTNPHYIVFTAYKVPEDEAHQIEKYVHRDLSRFDIDREAHSLSGRNSEWFSINAVQAIELLNWTLTHCLDNVSYDLDANRPSNYDEIRYTPPELLPADQNVLNRLQQEYLAKRQSRGTTDVVNWLYGE